MVTFGDRGAMNGYEVVIEAIEKSSGAAKRAADGVRSVDLASTLAGIPQGVAGGTAIEAARVLGEVWKRELPAWVKNMDEYSAQLSSAARRYRSNERAAAADLRVVTSRGGAKPL